MHQQSRPDAMLKCRAKHRVLNYFAKFLTTGIIENYISSFVLGKCKFVLSLMQEEFYISLSFAASLQIVLNGCSSDNF